MQQLVLNSVLRHYKGGQYFPLFIGRKKKIDGDIQPHIHSLVGLHHETKERIVLEACGEDEPNKLVLYQSLTDLRLWVRELDQFFDTLEFEGRTVPRFQPVSKT